MHIRDTKKRKRDQNECYTRVKITSVTNVYVEANSILSRARGGNLSFLSQN